MVLVSGLSTIYSQPSTGAQAPAYDGNGNILAYLDCTTCTVTQRMEYDAFGVEMSLDSVLTQPSTSNSQLPFRFSTKYKDSETSLSYYGYRYYSAEMGRWTARDPIEERGGMNLYGAVVNNAVNLVDADGRFIIEVIAAAAALITLKGFWISKCQEQAESKCGSLNPDSAKHCCYSCVYSKCSGLAPVETFIGGVVHEIIQAWGGSNTWQGAVDDIKSNLIGIILSYKTIWGNCRSDCAKCQTQWNG